jgi:hypothetical protein
MISPVNNGRLYENRRVVRPSHMDFRLLSTPPAPQGVVAAPPNRTDYYSSRRLALGHGERTQKTENPFARGINTQICPFPDLLEASFQLRKIVAYRHQVPVLPGLFHGECRGMQLHGTDVPRRPLDLADLCRSRGHRSVLPVAAGGVSAPGPYRFPGAHTPVRAERGRGFPYRRQRRRTGVYCRGGRCCHLRRLSGGYPGSGQPPLPLPLY